MDDINKPARQHQRQRQSTGNHIAVQLVSGPVTSSFRETNHHQRRQTGKSTPKNQVSLPSNSLDSHRRFRHWDDLCVCCPQTSKVLPKNLTRYIHHILHTTNPPNHPTPPLQYGHRHFTHAQPYCVRKRPHFFRSAAPPSFSLPPIHAVG